MAPCWLVGSVFALHYTGGSYSQFIAKLRSSSSKLSAVQLCSSTQLVSAMPPKNGVTTRYVAPLPGVHTQLLVIELA